MQVPNIKIYAFICTRSSNLRGTTRDLISYYSDCGIKTLLFVNKTSIFEAYASGLEKISANPNDIIILCHDDIEILSKKEQFLHHLTRLCCDLKTGFVGGAGTTKLSEDAIWWNQQNWHMGFHRGFIIHGKDNELQSTYYGPYGRVLCIDGLFLAARCKVLQDVGLEKPSIFSGEWDFYDIYYTYRANELGYHNQILPVFIRHESFGDLAGRDSWHQNREAFIKHYKLPKEIK